MHEFTAEIMFLSFKFKINIFLLAVIPDALFDSIYLKYLFSGIYNRIEFELPSLFY